MVRVKEETFLYCSNMAGAPLGIRKPWERKMNRGGRGSKVKL